MSDGKTCPKCHAWNEPYRKECQFCGWRLDKVPPSMLDSVGGYFLALVLAISAYCISLALAQVILGVPELLELWGWVQGVLVGAITGAIFTWYVPVRAEYIRKKYVEPSTDPASELNFMLVWYVLAACGTFIGILGLIGLWGGGASG